MNRVLLGCVTAVACWTMSVGQLFPSQDLRSRLPVTYPGDGDETLRRRVQWMEGARKEGVLVWWGTLNNVQANGVIGEFKKIYPFIDVRYWNQRGEEVATKLDAQFLSGRVEVDVVLGGEPINYPRWRKMGMFVPYTDLVPKLERLDNRLYSVYGDWMQPGNIVTTPQYHTGHVPASAAPRRWEDLLEGKWKGRVGITTDMKVWAVLAAADGGWGIEKTETFLRRLKDQQLIWGRGHTAMQNLLAAGEFNVHAELYLSTLLLLQDKNAPLDWCRVDPVVVSGPSLTLQQKAPHPNAARLFLEWIFSPQGFQAYDRVTSQGVAFPGTGTRQAKVIESAGVNVVARNERVEQKIIELGLNERFANLLGITR